MTTVTTKEARDQLSELVNRAAYGKERIVLTRRGKGIAALIPLDDLLALEQMMRRLEDHADLEAVQRALDEAKRKGTVSWEKVKKIWDSKEPVLYNIEVTPAAIRDLKRLPRNVCTVVKSAIDDLAKVPRPQGCEKMEGSDDVYRRCGDYRVIYQIRDDVLTVTVVRARHRRDVYKHISDLMKRLH